VWIVPVWLFQRPSPYIDQKIVGHQTLRSEWSEIKLDKPLKPIGDRQEIGLVLAAPYALKLVTPQGVIQLSDGTVIRPEVELIGSDDLPVQMRYSGSRGRKMIVFSLKDESIKKDYVRIRLRADREIPLDAVFWSGIVIKNMP
jgi:hypothetical protein